MQGECQFNDQDNSQENWQLSPYSRLSFLGCWLVFTHDHINKPSAKFIFKDSLSSQDYSRLRRIIVALK